MQNVLCFSRKSLKFALFFLPTAELGKSHQTIITIYSTRVTSITDDSVVYIMALPKLV